MFNEYPYTDYHELNTDWIIGRIKNVETAEANSKEYMEAAEESKNTAVQAKDDAVAAQEAAEDARDDAQQAKNDAETIVADTDNQIAVLQARVDNIIPDGTQTAGNTELLDIRVGENGTIYTSAGDAVRDQIGSLAHSLSGYDNFFVDPDFEYFNAGHTGNPAYTINKYLFKDYFCSTGFFTSSDKKIIKPAGVAGNAVYGCRIYNSDSVFNSAITFSIYAYNADAVTLSMYFRFYDISGTVIDTMSRNTSASGRIVFNATIPADTYEIQAWVQANSTYEWSFDKPILCPQGSLLYYDTKLWEIINLTSDTTPATGASYVSNEAELLTALAGNGVIYFKNNITVTSDISITSDVEIDGMGYTLTGSGLSSRLIGIAGANVTIKNLTMIGEMTTDYVVVPNTGSNVILENCIIQTAANSVVRCLNDAHVTIKHCDIGYSYGNDGLSPAGYSRVFVYDSKMHDCFDEGLSSHNFSYVEAHNCEFYNNGYVVGTTTPGAASTFGGCHIGGGNMGIVEGCYSHDNRTYGIALINFQEDLASDIEKCFNNLVENNGSHGIICTYCKHLTLTNNSAIHNTGDAIYFGVDPTHTSPIGIISSGYVGKNVMFENASDQVVIEPGAESPTLYIQA